MVALQGIWLLLPVNYLFKEDIREMFLSFQRHNLSTIMKRHLVRSILVEG